MDDENGRCRLDLYVEALRARMPADEFIALMRAFHAWRAAPHSPALPPDAGALRTPEIQAEMLALMRLTRPPGPGAGPPPPLTAALPGERETGPL
ncbi:hypothetical protein [Streptomyces sp. NPDC049879]|uniref:hypothetical protein n=1 Tax=Streptomyces sp. NPDC049879 TaxID=3365598 RepID=UPI00379A6B5B